jgi:LysM repeat protein
VSPVRPFRGARTNDRWLGRGVAATIGSPMSNSRRSRRGRSPVFLALAFLLGLVWLAGAAPTAAWWGFPQAHPYRYGGHFTLDTDLLSKSGLSAWAIDDYLAANTDLPPLGDAFMAAERKYGINARYLLAHAMLESGFGSSDIARYRHNLFGFHAYDRDPWRYATNFRTYAKGIDGIAHAIRAEYLSPHGRWWGGAPTLRGMHYYASDPNWAKKVAAIAAGLALPTLSSRGVHLGPLTPADPLEAGGRGVVSVGLDRGSMADMPGLRIAVRWRPLSLVEADPTADVAVPKSIAHAVFTAPAAAAWRSDSIDLTLAIPTRAGRYALDVVVLDVDGAALPDAARLAIPPTVVRVFPGRAISYGVTPTAAGIHVGATNLGPGPLSPAATAVPAARSEPGVAAPALTAWAMPLDGGAPTQVGRVGIRADVPVGGGAAFDVGGAALDPLLPAILVVRASGTGGNSLDLGPPGVFRLDPDPSGPGVLVTEVAPLDPAFTPLLTGRASAATATNPVSVVAGRTPTVSIRTTLVGPSAVMPDGMPTSDDRTIHATLAIDAVPVSGATATAVAFRAPIAAPAKLKPGTPIGGSVQIGIDPSGPTAYLAVARTIVAHGDGAVVGRPIVFWLISVGPPASTTTSPSPTKPKPAHAAKPKPKPKHHRRPAPRLAIHLVRAGETLWSISRHTGLSMDYLRRLNPWVMKVGIHPGDRLRI